MKVKFKMHDVDTLRYNGISDAELHKIPFFLFVNKEFVGDLDKNDIVLISRSGSVYRFDCKYCLTIRPYIIRKWRVIFATGEGRHLHTDAVIVAAETADRAVEVVKNELPKSKYHKVEEVEK